MVLAGVTEWAWWVAGAGVEGSDMVGKVEEQKELLIVMHK